MLLELQRDPWPVWARLRRDAPVFASDELGSTLITRYASVKRVVGDDATFSAEVESSLIMRTFGPNFMTADGAEHAKIRQLVAPLLSAGTVRRRHLGPLAEDARATVECAPTVCEVMAGVVEPLIERALMGLIGLSVEAGTGSRWFRGIAVAAADFEGEAANAALGRLICDEIDDRLRQALEAPAPPDSLLAAFAGTDCSFQELSSTVKLFVIGGLQEPRDLLGILLSVLLGDRPLMERLAADEGAMIRAVEEAARWGTPVGTAMRVAKHEVELDGVLVPGGTHLCAVLASANRDPEVFVDPDTFDIDRSGPPHLAYAGGAHACVGAAATRIIVRQLLTTLLPRLLRADLVEPVVLRGFEFRGPASVHVRW